MQDTTAFWNATGDPGGLDQRIHTGGVQLRIEGYDLPGASCGPSRDVPGGYRNVHVGVQRRNRPDELLGLTRGDAPSVIWTLDCTEVRRPEGLDLKGPHVQGRPGGRFVYLSWGTVGEDAAFQLFRRAKLWLDAVPVDVLATAAEQGVLVGRLPLTDGKGHPLCAAVRPPLIEWSAPCPAPPQARPAIDQTAPTGRWHRHAGLRVDGNALHVEGARHRVLRQGWKRAAPRAGQQRLRQSRSLMRDRPGWHDAVEELVAVVGGLAPARTLDLACGTGFLTRHLRGFVVGVDQSRAMVAVAQSRLPDGLAIAGDALDLVVADGSFERVFTAHFYGHLPPGERGAFLAEARRVGAELVVVDSALRPVSRRSRSNSGSSMTGPVTGCSSGT